MKKITINNWLFFLLVVIYFIFSGWLFLLTTGGWSGFGVLMYVWLPFAVLAIIMLIISIVRSAKQIKYISYNLLGLIPIIIFQLLGLLFNRIDCGDTSGSFSFISYLFNNFSTIGMCGNDKMYPWYDLTGWLVIIGIYVISIIISFFFLSKSVSSK